jgi:cellulase/cellobiase CelA1
MTPPPALRSRILAAISDTETQRIPAPSVAAPRPPVRVPVFSWYRFFPQIAMAVTAILLLALAGWSNSIRNRLDQTESELSQARAQLAGFSGNIFTTSLVSRNGTPSTRGNLVYMNQEKAGMVMVRNLPQPPTGMVYQAWAQINGQIRNLGALTLYPDGTGLIYLPADIAHMSTVMITLEREPLSPSPTPTGEILLEARIQ